ncbi:MAG: Holliday junction branch migration protein RuvA [Firmicutes bacterium]|nr:Holliday junction branch migration protein RuvA [Bacillota bacterium]
MIAYIEGIPEYIGKDSVIIGSGGIGYRIFVSAPTLAALKADERIRLYTYFSVQETGIALYGFRSREEEELFVMLTGVNSVGPKAAMALLSALSLSELVTAIVTDDEKALCMAQGIGKKTAARIILDLKDKFSDSKLGEYMGGEDISLPERASLPDSPFAEALSALAALGYSRAEAHKALAGAPSDADTEALLKYALGKMMKF